MLKVLAVLAAVAAFVGVLVFTTQRQAAVECSVCLDFAGRSACRTVAAADRDLALAGAVRNACAVLSGGVTQGLECERTPPRSQHCTE